MTVKRRELDQDKLAWEKMDGLLPAIVQDANTKDVLMVGYMDKEALNKTLDTEKVTFFSRSKKELWTKGETSGNFLNLVKIEMDCDEDALLIWVNPKGPTCHTGTDSCFGNTEESIAFLNSLATLIKTRREEKPEGSYVTSLFEKGSEKIAQKVGEEGVEVSLAHATKNTEETKEEAADLLFHLLILLEDAGLSLSEVISVLEKRHAK